MEISSRVSGAVASARIGCERIRGAIPGSNASFSSISVASCSGFPAATVANSKEPRSKTVGKAYILLSQSTPAWPRARRRRAPRTLGKNLRESARALDGSDWQPQGWARAPSRGRSADGRAREHLVVVGFEERDLITSAALGDIKRGIRAPEQSGKIRIHLHVGGHPDADSPAHGQAIHERSRARECPPHGLRRLDRRSRIGARQDGGEFLAPQTSDDTPRLEVPKQRLAEDLQHVVAEIVAVGVVGVLEMVEVEDQDRHGRSAENPALADGVGGFKQGPAICRPVRLSVSASWRCSSSSRSLAIESTVKAKAIRSSNVLRTKAGNHALVKIAATSWIGALR